MKLNIILIAAGLLSACGPSVNTNWLRKLEGTDTVKCSVIKGQTTEKEFLNQCGEAQLVQDSRGCKAYLRDSMTSIYYCFKDGKLDDILGPAGWVHKRGE